MGVHRLLISIALMWTSNPTRELRNTTGVFIAVILRITAFMPLLIDTGSQVEFIDTVRLLNTSLSPIIFAVSL